MLPWLAAAAGIAVLTVFLFHLENVVGLDDGLRHYMMGKAMAEQGIFAVRGWTQWFFTGYFHDHPVDPWFLADVLYVPFASLPPVTAIALFSICSSFFLAACFLLCLRALRVPPFIATLLVLLLLFGHSNFTYRLLLGRPFVVVSGLTLLIGLAVVRGRPVAVSLLLVVLTFLSHLFFFGLAVSLVGSLWLLWRKRRGLALRMLCWSFAGVAAGIALHPLPLEYARYLFLIFMKIPFLDLPDRGTELYPGVFHGETVYAMLGFAVLFHVMLYIHKGSEQKTLPPITLLLELWVAVFLAMFFLWIRAIDFLWPFALLLLGVLAADGAPIMRIVSSPLLRAARLKMGAILFVLFLSALTFGSLALSIIRSDDQRSLEPYRRALEQVPAGGLVLNLRWDDFPPLVAARPDLQFSFGMDPAFTLVSDSGSTALLRMVAAPHHLPDTRDSIDAGRWFSALTQRNPSDFVLLGVARTEPIVRALRSKGMKDLSGDPHAWALFRVPEKKS